MGKIEERVFINGENKIGATISRPDDKQRPLVLLIMGTGKTDRDGNMKGFKTDLYKNISDMFVDMPSRGIHERARGYEGECPFREH